MEPFYNLDCYDKTYRSHQIIVLGVATKLTEGFVGLVIEFIRQMKI